MTKKRNRILNFPHHISYRISPELFEEIQPLMAGKKLSAYARHVVNPDRILGLKDYKKLVAVAAVLKSFSKEFDCNIKVLRGVKNRTVISAENIQKPFHEFEFFLDKLSHQLYETEIEFRNIKSPRGTSKAKKIVEEEGNKTVKVDFKISEEMYQELKNKTVGNESVDQLCRAMLQPNPYIQPTDFELHKELSRIQIFYNSRLISMGKTFEEMVQEALKSHRMDDVKPIILRTVESMNKVDQQIQQVLGVNLYIRNKGQKKTGEIK